MNKVDLKSLTALRGLAALMVVLHHVGLLMLPLKSTVLAPFFGHLGTLGMSIFFCLSGFVIHYNYSDKVFKKNGKYNFLLARFARLAPLYLIFVLLNFCLNITILDSAHTKIYISTLLPNVFAFQSWFYFYVDGIPIYSSQGLANVAWSISSEIFLYFLFIPLVFLINNFKRSPFLGILLILFGVSFRSALVLFADTNRSIDPAFYDWLIYTSPYGRFFEFVVGVGVAELWLNGALRSNLMRVLGLFSIVILFLSLMNPLVIDLPSLFTGYSIYYVYIVFIPLLIGAFCSFENKSNFEFFPMVYIGELSYSIYLLHADLYPLFKTDMSGAFTHTFAFFIVLVLLSHFVYKVFEVPAKRYINRNFSK